MSESIQRDIVTPCERAAINGFIAANGVTVIPRGVSGFDYSPNGKHGKHFREAEFVILRQRYRTLIEAGLSPEEVANRMDVGATNVRLQARNLGLRFKARRCPSTELAKLERADRTIAARIMRKVGIKVVAA